LAKIEASQPMDIIEKRHLEVTVDKRHIISIGERLYAANWRHNTYFPIIQHRLKK
jgi:hypothetical protein